jgi:nicotinamide-nucleotide amidase
MKVGDEQIRAQAEQLAARLLATGLSLAAAESCTGGWVCKALTDLPGSSRWFGYGLVTYSNEAKQQLLGVRVETLSMDGAVSEATVREMAAGVLRLSGADLALAVSGVAGPDGGSEDKPVGTVWFAWARRRGIELELAADCRHFAGGREQVRRQAVWHAISGALASV